MFLQMDLRRKGKEVLIESAVHDDFPDFLKNFNRYKIVLKENFFDYKLLKVALSRQDKTIAYFLIKKGCRVRNPHMVNLEETPLHLAMSSNFEISYLSLMLHGGASIYDKNSKEETPLQTAFKENEHKAVDAVLDYISHCNLDLNPGDKDDVLHFHIACVRNHITCVKRYLKLGFDVNSYLSLESSELSGLNPLHYAISNGNCELFKILLNHGGDLTVKNCKGLTPLHIFYYNYYKFDFNNFEYDTLNLFQCKDEMIQIFTEAEYNMNLVDSVDSNEVSFLHIYCLINCPNLVQALINSGADVNRVISFNCSNNPGFTPLHFAIKHSHSEIIELLTKSGADYSIPDKNGITPNILLHEYFKTITMERMIKDIKMLGNYVINTTIADGACSTHADNIVLDKEGNTDVHLLFIKMFCHLNSLAVDAFQMSMLMSNKLLRVNVTNNEGISLFHIACARNDIISVNYFLNAGAKIDGRVESGLFAGYTALHFAVMFNKKNVVEMLLKKNARVDIETSKSKATPLHLACKHRWTKYCELTNNNTSNLDWTSNQSDQIDIIKLLILHGADVNAKDSSGSTPLHQACMIIKGKYAVMDWSKSFKSTLINDINARILKIVKILLTNKGNINACTNEKDSLLHIIAKNDYIKNPQNLLKLLLSFQVNLNAVNAAGLTPLHLAVEYENLLLTISLLRYKANINVKCHNSKTALQMAIKNECVHAGLDAEFYSKYICDLFLSECTDVDLLNQSGRTFLHDAVEDQKYAYIEKLLRCGANINMEDLSGNSTVCSLLTYLNEPQSLNHKVLEIIIVHIKKLLCLEKFISSKVMKVYTELCKYFKTLSSENEHVRNIDMENECIQELERMKLKKIDKFTSLYDILKKDTQQIAKHLKNEKFIKVFYVCKIEDEYPYYGYLLKIKFKKGKLRSDVLPSNPASLMWKIFDRNMPLTCYDVLFKYLTDKEIVNLKAATNE